MSASAFLEVIRIDPFDHIACCRGHAHIKVDHQTGQLLPVNQDHLGVDARRIVGSVGGVAGCGDEYAFFSPLPLQRTDKLLDFGSAN
jgi:hypothetical protein